MSLNTLHASSRVSNTSQFKAVLRSVNGLPLTNTEYIVEFPPARFGRNSGAESMVQVVSKDKLLQCGKYLFHVLNATYDLNLDLVCFSDSAIQFLRSEISNSNSPLWQVSQSCPDDLKINGSDSVPFLFSIFLKSNADLQQSVHNMQNFRHLLRDLLDEKTLNFLSEVFPVANGVAFPISFLRDSNDSGLFVDGHGGSSSSRLLWTSHVRVRSTHKAEMELQQKRSALIMDARDYITNI